MNPLVSIIVPTHNNEATIVRTLNSLIEQTLKDIEIIVVDDASEDSTVEVCREVAELDARVKVLPLPTNQTALQARRIGAVESRGSYVMFCDSDDELEPHAAETAVGFARGGKYDVVHFGTTIVSTTGSKHTDWERALDPFATELYGDDVLLQSPFGVRGARINGHIWNKLYERQLLVEAWSSIPDGLLLPRAQDVYQTLLILSRARRYGGLKTPLYRYNFRAGKSGNAADLDSFRHFLASKKTYEAVHSHLGSTEWRPPKEFDTDELAGRLEKQFIENQLRYWLRLPRPAHVAMEEMLSAWGTDSVLRVFANNFPSDALVIADAFGRIDPDNQPTHAVSSAPSTAKKAALIGNFAGIGGVQKVMSVQAHILSRAGYQVSILTFNHDPDEVIYELPTGASIHMLGDRQDVRTGTTELIRHIREHQFDLILNHDNYSPLLPWIGVVTRALQVPSAVFLHSFSLRAMHDFRAVFGHLPEIARTFDVMVTLSETDRQWWVASGVPTVRALPNFGPRIDQPTSPQVPVDEPNPYPVDLLWVGRLQDETKNVTGVLETFAQLQAIRPETTLAIVGGEQRPGDRAKLEKTAERLGVLDSVDFIGAVRDAVPWYRSAKVFLATASIEGFNLTLVEALAHGLPVAMYELPYLETVAGNPGIEGVEWGAADQLAKVAAELLEDSERREAMVKAGQAFIERFSHANYEARFSAIVDEIVRGPETSPGDDADIPEGTVAIPASMVNELYRLYLRMHSRTARELRSARRDGTDLRRNLSQLKKTLTDTQAQQQQLQRAISQAEKGKPVRSPKPSPRANQATRSTVGGAWPLWARANSHGMEIPETSPFEDLTPSDAVLLPAAWARDAGLLAEADATRFGSSQRINRHTFIKMLHRLAGAPDGGFASQIYSDLAADDAAIYWAIERNIMTRPKTAEGDENLPEWKPKTPVRRRMAAMLLYRAAGRPTYRAPLVSPYSDLDPEEKFYKEMCWAAHQGVLPATRQDDGTVAFDPNPVMTKGDTVSALFRQMVGPLVVFEGR